MTPNEFQPAENLDEANERLRTLEQSLAVERDRVRRRNEVAEFEAEVEFRDGPDDGAEIDGAEFIARIVAECEAADGQH